MGIFSNTRFPERTFTHRTCHRIGCVLEHPPVSSSRELIVACIGTSELCVLQTLTEALVAQSWQSLGHPLMRAHRLSMLELRSKWVSVVS